MLTNMPKTKLLVDGGDPEETLRIESLIGFVDGQTTNPSLIAKNPEIQRRLASGHQLSEQEEKDALHTVDPRRISSRATIHNGQHRCDPRCGRREQQLYSLFLPAGGGVKVYFTRHLGLRIQAEWLPIVVNPGVGSFACGAGCVVRLSGTAVSQGEIAVGPMFRF